MSDKCCGACSWFVIRKTSKKYPRKGDCTYPIPRLPHVYDIEIFCDVYEDSFKEEVRGIKYPSCPCWEEKMGE